MRPLAGITLIVGAMSLTSCGWQNAATVGSRTGSTGDGSRHCCFGLEYVVPHDRRH